MIEVAEVYLTKSALLLRKTRFTPPPSFTVFVNRRDSLERCIITKFVTAPRDAKYHAQRRVPARASHPDFPGFIIFYAHIAFLFRYRSLFPTFVEREADIAFPPVTRIFSGVFRVRECQYAREKLLYISRF